MGLYRRLILPRLLHLVMRSRELTPYRVQLIPQAGGQVLELGIGSGLNLPFYTAQVTRLYGLDPSLALLRLARRQAARASVPVLLLHGLAEALPLADASLDTVVSTWTLCTITGIEAALAEARRVLRPQGQLLFVEHGLAPQPRVAAWQRRLTPWWQPLAGGCHLDRPIAALLEAAGWRLAELHTTYLRGPRPWTYTYWGRAVP
ncbi:MAG: methyltransferase [Candidatus Tectimicrobiota bacterium]|nr:MAG: methyltransferase [Candidatus Tectomicrobia bacterium]